MPDIQYSNFPKYKETGQRHLTLSLNPSIPKDLPYLLTLKLKDYGLIHTRKNRAGTHVRKRKENRLISVNQ